MTKDKQIIIDGVDVSGCLFYQTNFEEDYDVKIKHYCSNWHNSCESNNNSNCYYKQLKAKEQECKDLKNDNKELQYQLRCTTGREKEWERNCKFWDARCEKLQTELDQLKADNKELKEQLELNTANAVVIDMAQRLYNYKQAIEKIKELIQKEIDDCFDCGDCISCGYNCCLRQAMQICNEVISE